MIFHKKTQDRYVCVSKTPIEDDRLSWKAKGILIFLLSKPPEWNVSALHLSKQARDGIDSVYAGLKELEANFYLWRRPNCGEDAGGYEYFVYEEPCLKSPFPQPDRDFPGSGESPPNDYGSNNEEEVVEVKKLGGIKVIPFHLLPVTLNTKEFRETWKQWLVFRNEKKKPVTESGSVLVWRKINQWGVDGAIKSIHNSIELGWTGLFEPKQDRGKKQNADGSVEMGFPSFGC